MEEPKKPGVFPRELLPPSNAWEHEAMNHIKAWRKWALYLETKLFELEKEKENG